MSRKNVGALSGAMVLMLVGAAGALASAGPSVAVRVEGLKRTLLLPTVTKTHGGWITRYGAPKGACSAESAQGALDVATHHRWRGTWTTSFGPEYEITSILGETHAFSSKYFWEIFVDKVPASAGACELKLHRGVQLLFAAVPQTGNAYPTAIRGPKRATLGVPFSVKVLYFNGQGKAKPLAGARVSASGPQMAGAVTTTTNKNGVAKVVALHPGKLVLHAAHNWSASAAYVRAAPMTVQVS